VKHRIVTDGNLFVVESLVHRHRWFAPWIKVEVWEPRCEPVRVMGWQIPVPKVFKSITDAQSLLDVLNARHEWRPVGQDEKSQ
jgi:hypothetical protein